MIVCNRFVEWIPPRYLLRDFPIYASFLAKLIRQGEEKKTNSKNSLKYFVVAVPLEPRLLPLLPRKYTLPLPPRPLWGWLS